MLTQTAKPDEVCPCMQTMVDSMLACGPEQKAECEAGLTQESVKPILSLCPQINCNAAPRVMASVSLVFITIAAAAAQLF